MRRKMSKKKAERKLAYWKETLQYWRTTYVESIKDANFQSMKGISSVYEETLEEYKQNMQECKEMIAKFERIVL